VLRSLFAFHGSVALLKRRTKTDDTDNFLVTVGGERRHQIN
jgi:hypothetical protein